MIFNIEKLRKDLITKRLIEGKLTLRQAAEKVGVSSATLNRIENSRLPDVETFAKCCIWLETDAKSYFNIPVKRQDGFRAQEKSE